MAYLAIDIGTHSVRAAIISEQGVQGLCERSIALSRYDDHRVEQSPLEILDAIRYCVSSLSASMSLRMDVAVACQRSSVMAWRSDNGEALSPVISWQDTRAASLIDSLDSSIRSEIISSTGLRSSAHYGASKLSVLHDTYSLAQPSHTPSPSSSHSASLNDRRVGQAHLSYGPLVSWLLHHLLLGSANVCDESNAARTLLWNIHTREWDKKLCTYFGVERECLPKVKPVLADYGHLDSDFLGIKSELNLTAVCGDQNAAYCALYAARLVPENIDVDKVKATRPFDALFKKANTNCCLINLGTGAFVLQGKLQANNTLSTNPARLSAEKALLNTLLFSDQNSLVTALEGTVNGAGAAISYFVNTLSSFKDEAEFFHCIENATNNDTADENGEGSNADYWQHQSIFINTVGSLGAPWWNHSLSAQDSKFYRLLEGDLICDDIVSDPSSIGNTSRDVQHDVQTVCSQQEKAFALIESIVFLLIVILNGMAKPKTLVATGGLARSQYLLEALASLSNATVLAPKEHEMTLMGGGALASHFSLPLSFTTREVKPQKLNEPALKKRFKAWLGLMEQLNSTQINNRVIT